MPYRSLLVLLDQGDLNTQRTDIAIRLAKELDCRLVGLAPTGMVDMPTSRATGALAEFAALALDSLRDEATQTAQEFRDRCHAAGLASNEAVVDESDKALSILHHAHCSDLVLLTQADPQLLDHAQTEAMVEQVVLRSARPVLILPYVGRFERIGTNALVAWDDSPEAARALADAMPLLARARDVTIVRWQKAGSTSAGRVREQLDALSRWLMYHGVNAQVRLQSTGAPIADAMLSHAADHDVDLLVMGAYGHSRWSERLLGGATRGVLASMTVPVLMSH